MTTTDQLLCHLIDAVHTNTSILSVLAYVVVKDKDARNTIHDLTANGSKEEHDYKTFLEHIS